MIMRKPVVKSGTLSQVFEQLQNEVKVGKSCNKK